MTFHVEPGWYVPTHSFNGSTLHPRWVLAVNAGYVLYANGGDEHRECQVKTFRRWARISKAQRMSRQ